MEQLPKIVQRHLQGTQKPGVHPDPDLLAAFAEKSLTGGERVRVLQHLAECSDCREVISLAAPEIAPAPSPSSERSPRLSWPVLRWGALAACVLVVSAAVTLHYERRPSFKDLSAPGSLTAQENTPEQPAEKLAVNTAPPSPAQSHRDFGTAAGKLSKQRDKSAEVSAAPQPRASAVDELDQDQSVRGFTNDRLADGLVAKSADKPASPARSAAAASSAPLPPTKTAGVSPQSEARSDAADQGPRVMNETVTIQGAARSVQVMPPVAEPKAKDESSKKDAQKEGQTARAGVAGAIATDDREEGTISAETASIASPQFAKRSRAAFKTAYRWSLSADGGVQRSLDSGKNWQTIPVASNVVFRALAANDSDIWVGGAAGALYHSSDAGQSWTQVKPVADGKPLTADVIAIEFSDAQHGKLTTGSHETGSYEIWTTGDAGNSWQSH